MFHPVVLFTFAVSVLLAAYPFVIYPVILWIQTRRLQAHRSNFDLPVPTFDVIIPCHNEEKVIERKILNMLECAARAGAEFTITVVSDGSNDRTCEIARQFGSRVRVIELRNRSGILGAFKAGLTSSHGDVVIFSDADIRLVPDALRTMLSHYADPTVGGVCGFTAMEVQSGSGLNAEQAHIGYRAFVRDRQSRLHSVIGADGSNWSVRRGLVSLPTQKVIADDLIIPLEVVHAGYRYIFERRAIAVETSAPSVESEFQRRIRTIAGGMQGATYCSWMFSARYWRVGFHFASSKLAKHATILWVSLAALCSIWLANDSVFFAAMAFSFASLLSLS